MTRYTSTFRQSGLTPDEIPQLASQQPSQIDEKLLFKTGRRETDQKSNDNQVKKLEKKYEFGCSSKIFSKQPKAFK